MLDDQNNKEANSNLERSFPIPIEGMLGLFAFGAQGILLWKEAKRLHAEELENKLDSGETRNEEE